MSLLLICLMVFFFIFVHAFLLFDTPMRGEGTANILTLHLKIISKLSSSPHATPQSLNS